MLQRRTCARRASRSKKILTTTQPFSLSNQPFFLRRMMKPQIFLRLRRGEIKSIRGEIKAPRGSKPYPSPTHMISTHPPPWGPLRKKGKVSLTLTYLRDIRYLCGHSVMLHELQRAVLAEFVGTLLFQVWRVPSRSTTQHLRQHAHPHRLLVAWRLCINS